MAAANPHLANIPKELKTIFSHLPNNPVKLNKNNTLVLLDFEDGKYPDFLIEKLKDLLQDPNIRFCLFKNFEKDNMGDPGKIIFFGDQQANVDSVKKSIEMMNRDRFEKDGYPIRYVSVCLPMNGGEKKPLEENRKFAIQKVVHQHIKEKMLLSFRPIDEVARLVELQEAVDNVNRFTFSETKQQILKHLIALCEHGYPEALFLLAEVLVNGKLDQTDKRAACELIDWACQFSQDEQFIKSAQKFAKDNSLQVKGSGHYFSGIKKLLTILEQSCSRDDSIIAQERKRQKDFAKEKSFYLLYLYLQGPFPRAHDEVDSTLIEPVLKKPILVKEDKKRIHPVLLALCEQGHAEALFLLAQLAYEGKGVVSDAVSSYHLAQLARMRTSNPKLIAAIEAFSKRFRSGIETVPCNQRFMPCIHGLDAQALREAYEIQETLVWLVSKSIPQEKSEINTRDTSSLEWMIEFIRNPTVDRLRESLKAFADLQKKQEFSDSSVSTLINANSQNVSELLGGTLFGLIIYVKKQRQLIKKEYLKRLLGYLIDDLESFSLYPESVSQLGDYLSSSKNVYGPLRMEDETKDWFPQILELSQQYDECSRQIAPVHADPSLEEYEAAVSNLADQDPMKGALQRRLNYYRHPDVAARRAGGSAGVEVGEEKRAADVPVETQSELDESPENLKLENLGKELERVLQEQDLGIITACINRIAEFIGSLTERYSHEERDFLRKYVRAKLQPYLEEELAFSDAVVVVEILKQIKSDLEKPFAQTSFLREQYPVCAAILNGGKVEAWEGPLGEIDKAWEEEDQDKVILHFWDQRSQLIEIKKDCAKKVTALDPKKSGERVFFEKYALPLLDLWLEKLPGSDLSEVLYLFQKIQGDIQHPLERTFLFYRYYPVCARFLNENSADVLNDPRLVEALNRELKVACDREDPIVIDLVNKRKHQLQSAPASSSSKISDSSDVSYFGGPSKVVSKEGSPSSEQSLSK